MEQKIVRFPGVVHRLRTVVPTQLDLFKSPKDTAKYFAFLNLADADQVVLLHILAKNAVSTLIDLRAIPVFEAPAFNHQEVVEYINSNGIIYFEYAVATMENYIESDYKIARTINAKRGEGLTLCIYDDDSLTGGVVASARAKFNRSNFYSVEISPRALAAEY